MTNAEARFNKSLRPRKPEGSLGRTAQDVHLTQFLVNYVTLNYHTFNLSYLFTCYIDGMSQSKFPFRHNKVCDKLVYCSQSSKVKL